jgi:hypothetical protein
MGGPGSCARERRAQSELVGFVLVIGLVLLGSAIVVGFGAIAISDTEEQLSADRAEKALTQFDSKAALVALGESGSYDVSFGSGVTADTGLELRETGWMRVTITDRTDGSTDQVMNISPLGAIVYEGEQSKLAYQGGGVWREDERGGQMISSPEFHYRGETLTLPAINVSASGSVDEQLTIERESSVQHYPDPADGEFNPVRNSVVNVTVGSEFYRAWGQYFEARTDGQVDLDDDNRTASLTLSSPIGNITAESIVAGQGSSGNLTFQGNPQHPCHSGGSKPPYADSYNSSEGGYCDQYDEDTIRSAGDVTFGGNIFTDSASGAVQGELVSGASLELHGNAPIYGNISYVDSCQVTRGGKPGCENAQASGPYSVEQIDNVQPSPRIDFAIDSAATDVYRGGERVDLGTGATETATLDSGEYHTDSIDLDNEDVVLNTSNGDITLIVNETIRLTGSSNLTVVGDSDANVYVDGGGPGVTDMEVTDSTVFAPNNDASKLTVLGRSNFTATVEDGEYTGVVYGPPGESGTGSVDVFGHVYGAIVTGDLTVGGTGGVGGGAGGTIHYDTELQDQQVVPPDRSIIRLTFLHITENTITVDG